MIHRRTVVNGKAALLQDSEVDTTRIARALRCQSTVGKTLVLTIVARTAPELVSIWYDQRTYISYRVLSRSKLLKSCM